MKKPFEVDDDDDTDPLTLVEGLLFMLNIAHLGDLKIYHYGNLFHWTSKEANPWSLSQAIL